MAQAAVAMEDLTEQPMWDLFLRYLKAAQEQWRGERGALVDMLVQSDSMAEGTILGVRFKIARLDERIRVVDAIIGLPKDLIGKGENAKSVVERMEADAVSS